MFSATSFQPVSISGVSFLYFGLEGGVPATRNFSKDAAITLLEDDGFIVTLAEAYDSFVDPGLAIGTEPVAGTVLPSGSNVVLYVSRSVLMTLTEVRPVFNYPIAPGSTSVRLRLRILNANGTPRTGLGWNTSGLSFRYRRDLSASVNMSLASLASLASPWTPGGFIEVGDGYYALDVYDAAFVEGVRTVYVEGSLTGAVVIGAQADLVDLTSEGGGTGGNVTHMNGVRIIGDGTRGNLFRGDPTLP